MNRLVFAVLSLAIATPAVAALPPEAYERARAEATDVVVFDVTHVGAPSGVQGDCIVEGKVIRSERGERFRPGDPIRLSVPCRTPLATPMPGPTVWQDMEALQRSAHGRAHLDADGSLALGQYELYDLH